MDKEQQLRLDEKMARRLQGEEDDHARGLREERQRRREAKAREEAMRERAEKARADEQARIDAMAKEKAERERLKQEAKSKKSSFMGGSTNKPQQKRAPFNFEAVSVAHGMRSEALGE